jgi:hypothetical protein
MNAVIENSKYSTAAAMAYLTKLVIPFTQDWAPKLFPDESYWMTGSTGEIHGKPVMAKKHRLAARWTFEDNEAVNADEVVEKFYKEVAAELQYDIDLMAKHGFIICPYIPLETVGVLIDPISFEPVVSFMSNYGTIVR